MSCAFCEEFDGATSGPLRDRIIWQSDTLVLLPTVGCLVPGYCLLMPREHCRAFAMLDPLDLSEALDVAEQQRRLISGLFGDVIIAEHGTGAPDDRGAGCCDHAHLHLIPLPEAAQREELLNSYQQVGGAPTRLTSTGALGTHAGGSYMSLSPRPGEWLVWTRTAPFASQFVRRHSARLLGLPNRFDWRHHQFLDNMAITASRLRQALADVCPARAA